MGDEAANQESYYVLSKNGIKLVYGMTRFISVLTLLGAFSWNAHAASVTYIMDQSNALAEPVDYMSVTIDDEGVVGDINFTVSLLPALTSIAGTNFGIQTFGFNLAVGATAPTDANITQPSGWTVGSGNQDGFGSFDISLTGTGSTKQNPSLEFSITGIDGDTLLSYYALSSGTAGEGNTYFGSHVTGFLDQNPGGTELTSAYFGGGRSGSGAPPEVPVPAAIWLFGTALLGFVGFSRKTKV